MHHLLSNGRKTEFLIMDFWENEFNKPADETVVQSMPLLVSIFNPRLMQLELDPSDQQSAERMSAACPISS